VTFMKHLKGDASYKSLGTSTLEVVFRGLDLWI
jgi:hypothetical protein